MARGEVTGKKPAHTKDGPRYERKPVRADSHSLALSIAEFCRLHGFSVDQYFKMQREGWGPTTMKVGSRTLISHEAAEKWRREREVAAKDDAAKKLPKPQRRKTPQPPPPDIRSPGYDLPRLALLIGSPGPNRRRKSQ